MDWSMMPGPEGDIYSNSQTGVSTGFRPDDFDTAGADPYAGMSWLSRYNAGDPSLNDSVWYHGGVSTPSLSVNSLLASTLSKAGMEDYDFNDAINKSAAGKAPTGGWMIGNNPYEHFNSILGYTGNPDLMKYQVSPNSTQYMQGLAQGRNFDLMNEEDWKSVATNNRVDNQQMPLIFLSLLAGGFGGAALGGAEAGAGAAAGAEAGAAEGGAFSGMAGVGGEIPAYSAGAATGAGAGAGGLDAIGQMVTQVPEGMTATQYAQTLGYPSADEWLSSMGAGAAGVGADVGNYYPNDNTPPPNAEPGDIGNYYPNDNPVPSWMDQLYNKYKSINSFINKPLFSTPGGVQFGSLNSMYNIGSGLYGLYKSRQQQKLAEEMAKRADPFGQYRDQYAQQMQRLMQDPAYLQQMPGYKAGLQAVERRMAAQGYNGSGNMMAALAQYGGDFYNQTMAQLGGFAGAGVNPGNAAQLALSGSNNAASMGMQSLNRIGYGLAR